MSDVSPPSPTGASVPRSFLDYVRSFGPGIVIVLTWLGAGDVVDMGVAGSTYGYSLLWVLVLALLMRFAFVSLIARYQLCNQHGETLLDGLVRLHRWFAPGLFIGALVMGHVYGSYMTIGVGEICRNVFGYGAPWQWAIVCNGAAFALVFQPAYRRLEWFFLACLVVLSVSFLGSAIWVGFEPANLAAGFFRFELPGNHGAFESIEVALAMIGALAGSIMNLAYPYFLEGKGWRGPQYRRVQFYDFLLGIIVMILLNLAVWILGAELLFPDKHITRTEDLPNLLSTVLGPAGRLLFYAGVFAAVYTSIIGHAAGLGCLGSHAWLRWKAGPGAPLATDYRKHPCYRVIVFACVVTPLVWTVPGMPGFVELTLAANSGQVVLLPILYGSLWWITANKRFIGATHVNRWWENLVMTLLFALALVSAYKAIGRLIERIFG